MISHYDKDNYEHVKSVVLPLLIMVCPCRATAVIFHCKHSSDRRRVSNRDNMDVTVNVFFASSKYAQNNSRIKLSMKYKFLFINCERLRDALSSGINIFG